MEPSDPTLRIERGGDGVLLLSGELDLWTASQLWDAVVDLSDGGDALTLDLAGVSFIDSGGLRQLIRISKRHAGKGGAVTLRSVPDRVVRLIELAGVGEELGRIE